MEETVRLDKWLWAARFFRTRTLARDAIAGGKVEVQGRRAKAGTAVRTGDRLTIRRGGERFEITVRDTGDRRVSADQVGDKYVEDPESLTRRAREAEEARQARGERPRRPGKRERRQIVRFMRRDR